MLIREYKDSMARMGKMYEEAKNQLTECHQKINEFSELLRIVEVKHNLSDLIREIMDEKNIFSKKQYAITMLESDILKKLIKEVMQENKPEN